MGWVVLIEDKQGFAAQHGYARANGKLSKRKVVYSSKSEAESVAALAVAHLDPNHKAVVDRCY